MLPERLEKRRFHATRGMPRAGFEQNSPAALEGLLPESFYDRAAANRFIRKEVGGAHEHTDAHSPFGKRRGHCLHHRCRPGVMNAAGKYDAQLRRRDPFADFVEEHLDDGVPKYKAGARANVAAAFASLEDEASSSVVQEHAQQRGSGHVQIGPNPVLFERCGLVRPSARDDGEWGMKFPYGLQLLGAQFRGHETENADAPGSLAEQFLRFREELPHLRSAQER